MKPLLIHFSARLNKSHLVWQKHIFLCYQISESPTSCLCLMPCTFVTYSLWLSCVSVLPSNTLHLSAEPLIGHKRGVRLYYMYIAHG